MDRRRLLSIGRFARITGLTVRALRHYDELGLLRPAHVDPDTGYRYYESSQAADAVTVRRLREIEVPLDAITELLASRDPSALTRTLSAHRERMAARAAEAARILDDVNRYLADADAVFVTPADVPVERDLPDEVVVSVRVRTDAEELAPVVLAAFARGRTFLLERDMEPVGPPTLVAPFPDDSGVYDLEAAWPISATVEGSEDVAVTRLAACRAAIVRHRGPYKELDAAYRTLLRYLDENDLSSAAAPREVYVTNPQTTKPADALTDVVWPVVSISEQGRT